jgi:hypothetical protein
MLPYRPWLAFVAGLTLAIIPIATTYPGVEVPAWAGLGLAVLSAAAAYLLKSMAPASDVHKDSALLPASPLSDEDVRRIAEEREKIRRDEIRRIREAGSRV